MRRYLFYEKMGCPILCVPEGWLLASISSETTFSFPAVPRQWWALGIRFEAESFARHE
jgi:hypothetical protein